MLDQPARELRQREYEHQVEEQLQERRPLRIPGLSY
jgi:hypothetical protein